VLRAGTKLIGLLLEPAKADFPLLGSGITLASLQAWGQRPSSRLRLKIWQIGVAIKSATILSSFPSKLSMPGGLSLLIDYNNFSNSPTLTLQNSNLQCVFLCMSTMAHCSLFAFPVLWSLQPMDTDTAWEQSSTVLVKMWSTWPPEWCSGLRHCIAVASCAARDPGSSPDSVTAGRDRETHGAGYNRPTVVLVRGGFGRQGCSCSIALYDSCGGPGAMHADTFAKCTQWCGWLPG
jgi:hypothetical protein